MTNDLIKNRLLERTLKLALVQQRAAVKQAAENALQDYGNGHLQEAQAALDAIFEIDPEQADALHLQGLIALDHKNYEKAETLFSKALEKRPDFPLAHYNRGNGFRETKQLERAAESYHRAIEYVPDFCDALGNLGLTYILLKDDVRAVKYLLNALILKPDYAQALNNLGNIYRRQNRHKEAGTLYRKSVADDPGFAPGFSNVGNSYRDLGQMDRAIDYFERALKIDPDLADAHNNLGLAYLLTGAFEEGWREYQWRHKVENGPPAVTHHQKPKWDGSDFSGKTLYIYPEQGFGDVIQFSRYIPLVANRGGHIIYRVAPVLAELVGTLDSVGAINLESEPEPKNFDIHVSLMDLPQVMRTTIENIPGNCPYFHVDKNRIKIWGRRLGVKKSFRVGLIWAGQPNHENDHNRSIDPGIFAPLCKIDEVSLFSLQMGHPDQASEVFGKDVTDLTSQINSFSDTAAAMKNLDLVLSVDTSAAHLAGAIGCKVWTLLPFMPDWRWLLNRTDSPWYPQMTLYRQPEIGDWSSVIGQVAGDIKKLVRDG